MAFIIHTNVLAGSTAKKFFSFVIFVQNIFKEILNLIVDPLFFKLYLKKFYPYFCPYLIVNPVFITFF